MKKPKPLSDYGPTSFNPKRRIAAENNFGAIASQVRYAGNPMHKSNPGDFGLTPPAEPRPHKTLCDQADITTRKEAVDYLRRGIEIGLVSHQIDQGYPKNVWAVKEVKGGLIALEAILENAGMGEYHGYPLKDDDPFRKTVLKAWRSRS